MEMAIGQETRGAIEGDAVHGCHHGFPEDREVCGLIPETVRVSHEECILAGVEDIVAWKKHVGSKPRDMAGALKSVATKRHDGDISRTGCQFPSGRAARSEQRNREIVIVVHVRRSVETDVRAIRSWLKIVSGEYMPVRYQVETFISKIEKASGVPSKLAICEQVEPSSTEDDWVDRSIT
jgi:hypothetical protein